MAELIDKYRALARIKLPGSDPVDGVLSLSRHSSSGGGPETILELLNSSVRIVPLVLADEDAVLMLTRQNIEWIAPFPSVDSEFVCPITFLVTREEAVHLTFLDGHTIDGLLQMELPEGKNRVSDFLNADDPFFPLRTEHGIVLINKAQVRDTRVIFPSPLPEIVGGS